mmetsp:Transcript_2722/g.9177  ORF Transcript_2722/g.9177 Transcript_2722/m.9177 type:complete len:210 (+) Transcript_2722:1458-2087(+)
MKGLVHVLPDVLPLLGVQVGNPVPAAPTQQSHQELQAILARLRAHLQGMLQQHHEAELVHHGAPLEEVQDRRVPLDAQHEPHEALLELGVQGLGLVRGLQLLAGGIRRGEAIAHLVVVYLAKLRSPGLPHIHRPAIAKEFLPQGSPLHEEVVSLSSIPSREVVLQRLRHRLVGAPATKPLPRLATAIGLLLRGDEIQCRGGRGGTCLLR